VSTVKPTIGAVGPDSALEVYRPATRPVKRIPPSTMAQVIDLVTPSPTSTINLVSSEASLGSGSTWLTQGSGDSIGRHYNPTENWMIWTNSSYFPDRRSGRWRQAQRMSRWFNTAENPFGF